MDEDGGGQGGADSPVGAVGVVGDSSISALSSGGVAAGVGAGEGVWGAPPQGGKRTMDFLNRGKMATKGKLSKMIYVKPYEHTEDEAAKEGKEDIMDDEDDTQSEKENLSDFLLQHQQKRRTPADLPRARSLEQFPSPGLRGSSGGTDVSVGGRRGSYEKPRGRSLGTPTTTHSPAPIASGTIHASPLRRTLKW
ncbi:uncharacterized protein LOC125032575 isoform X2 [Penaeus chinensis]|uniref:uncharacterized protein LOC125032575 isoform X2 n=1 Tax=Penaeus chinensis TaxID=139456 RepID=UPI001FB7FFD9|nr:uncharacterized protein LOC125032575 isoform X2 [Penaeus chinensis]